MKLITWGIRSLAAATALVLLVGCDVEEDRRQAQVHNEQSLTRPELVGTTPDGRQVNRVLVLYKDPDHISLRKHYIYFVGNDVTVNYDVSSGKATVGQTIALLQQAKTPEEALAATKQLEINIQAQKDEQRRKDAEEYERLKQKLGK